MTNTLTHRATAALAAVALAGTAGLAVQTGRESVSHDVQTAKSSWRAKTAPQTVRGAYQAAERLTATVPSVRKWR